MDLFRVRVNLRFTLFY